MKINDMPDKVLKVIIIKMLTKPGRRMDENSEKFNKEKIFFKKSELKNTITEMKNPLEGLNCLVKDAEELSSDLEDRVVEILQEEQHKEKQILKNEDILRDL